MTCDKHPLADLKKLEAWHKSQHPELGFLWGMERDNQRLRGLLENIFNGLTSKGIPKNSKLKEMADTIARYLVGE